MADGCTDATASLARAAGADVLESPSRQGKATALLMGWRHLLRERSVSAILMLDGDGQHAPEEIPAFLKVWSTAGCDLLVGQRDLSAPAMPCLRQLTNRLMSGAIQRLSGIRCPDTQCGFRLASRAFLSSRAWRSTHFELESEMILHAGADRWTVQNLPVKTIYHGKRSYIRVWPDLKRWLHLLKALPKNGRHAADLIANPTL